MPLFDLHTVGFWALKNTTKMAGIEHLQAQDALTLFHLLHILVPQSNNPSTAPPMLPKTPNYAFGLALKTGTLNWLRYCVPFRDVKAYNIQSIFLFRDIHRSVSSAVGGMENDTGIETPSGPIFNSCIKTFLSAVHRDTVAVLVVRPRDLSVNSHISCTLKPSLGMSFIRV